MREYDASDPTLVSRGDAGQIWLRCASVGGTHTTHDDCHLFGRGGDYVRTKMSVLSSVPSDHELVRRTLAGEPRAFEQLVDKHQRLVFGVALSGARDPAQAEEVAQEAFVEAWRKLPRLRDPARVGSWIAGIARNLARRWERHTARRRRREASAMQVPQDVVPTPLDCTLDRETQALVRDALARIPEAYRETLVLYYVDGRSVAEVASGLGISEDLVKQRLSRGRRALRSSLEVRVEGALEQLGPSKGFTAMVMVAVSTAIARNAAAAGTAGAAGKVVFGMNAGKGAVIGMAVIVAGGVGWYGHSSSASDRQPRAAEKLVPGVASASRDPDERAGAPNVRKVMNAEAREQLLRAIRGAHQRRAATATPATAAPSSAPPPSLASTTIDGDSGDLDKAYIREAMSGLLPMIVDCYKAALEKQPALTGRLVVNFTIEGEPGIGGLVTESAIDPAQSEIQDPGMGQCVQETMFALEIDPPSNGGTVKVTYPFLFEPKG